MHGQQNIKLMHGTFIKIITCHQNPYSGCRVHLTRWTDGQTNKQRDGSIDMTQLIVAFLNFVDAPKHWLTILVFWDVRVNLFRWASGFRGFKYRLSFIFRVKGSKKNRSSERHGIAHILTRRHTSKDSNFQHHRCQNIKNHSAHSVHINHSMTI
jgi:hypothetical protein